MQSDSERVCGHCGKCCFAKRCPHCGYSIIMAGEAQICQRCGGVFKHGRCFQCGWSGEPVTEKERRTAHDGQRVLGQFELESVERRLHRTATLLRIDGSYKDYLEPGVLSRDIETGSVDDAMDRAFAAAHEVRAPMPNWIGYFESVATVYLERLHGRNQGAAAHDRLAPAAPPGLVR